MGGLGSVDDRDARVPGGGELDDAELRNWSSASRTGARHPELQRTRRRVAVAGLEFALLKRLEDLVVDVVSDAGRAGQW